MRRTRGRIAVVLLVLGLVAAGCTGAPRPESVAAGKGGTDGASESTSGDEVTDTTLAPTDPAAVAATGPGGPAAGPGAKAAGRRPGEQATTAGASTTPGVRGADGITPANLFSAAQDRQGISDTTITICGHAALIFASAFNTSVEDLNVYWEDLRSRGGVHGRNVSASYGDDRYDPAAAREAAEQCKGKNPFFILGGIGFDQIPNVRNWAEDNKQLYIHHIAVGKGAEHLKYSFTPQPTVEQVGTASGEYIVNRYRDKKIGIVYRNSEHWEPGRSAGKGYMQKHGVDIVRDVAVERNQGVYSQQVLALKGQAEVVWIWENALAAAEFIKQAHAQDYFPTFVVFPFQTTLDIVGRDALKSRIDGISTWPAYKPGGYTGQHAFPGTGYQEEIQRFEAAMRRFRPGVAPNDILWQVWLANKGIEDLFQRCGRDCTRNRFAGVLMAYKGTVAPSCPVDYPRGGGHRGGWNTFMTQEAFDPGGNATPQYRNTSWCREHLN
jgi:ABC-type branched-subunit amino acid transport system substrate-binding protein